ncbi:hypothetical protein B0T25DRAFT_480413 [Lasiosphaeria hispida]|uniref:Nephrocystin 3-like N-terminal domain-containing protein n=1 Tax=Lasiosphaeria hispida TaxID=260671 RepID=A0AAJ0HJI6_9PEZI|nr:hypothetical protein B0T25DRAFT_480413 [Lasiosphaeria hispida]
MTTKPLPDGIEVLWEPPQPAEIDIDIVAVPGLGAHPKDCWTRRISDEEGGFNWLSDKDGLRRVVGENVRILLFHVMASSVRGSHSMDFLSGALLCGLQSARSTKHGGSPRPVVFIGHSTGGLIVAKAIFDARVERARFPGLFEAICGAVFIGTPFGGSSPAARLVADLDPGSNSEHLVQEVESPLLGLIFPNIDNNALTELKEDFLAAAKQGNTKMELFCFCEELETDLTWLMPRAMGDSWAKFISSNPKHLMVPGDGSANLPGYGSICIPKDHANLVKFVNSHDPSLTVMLDPIQRVVKSALEMVERRFDEAEGGIVDESSVTAVLNALDGIEVEERYRKMWMMKEKAEFGLPDGAPSVFDSKKFSDWLDVGEGTHPIQCLRISGRDGRGKGAATVSVIHKIRQSRTPVLLAYFFCGPVYHGKSSAEALLRSLLRQLISQQRSLYRYATQFAPVEPAADGFPRGPSPFSEAEFTFENLRSALCRILEDELVRTVYFVIHGIDKLDQGSDATKKLMDFLQKEVESNYSTRSWYGAERVRAAKVRWLFTTQEPVLIKSMKQQEVTAQHINLDDESHDAEVKVRLRNHSNRAISMLEDEKGYDKAFSYVASSLMARQANASSWGTSWIDIAAHRLRGIPADAGTPEVRRRLESWPRDMDELILTKWKTFLDNADGRVFDDTKEILRALILCNKNPTLDELVVLTDLSSKRVEELLSRHKSQLFAALKDDGTVVFPAGDDGGDAVKIHMRSKAASLLGLDGGDEMTWQHGVLAWRCFVDLRRKPCRYSIEHWVSHAKLANEELAGRISCEDTFWERDSAVRRQWLDEYEGFFSLASGIKFPQYLTAERSTGLHTATAVGYAGLVSALMKRSKIKSRFGGEREENMHNGNGHIPLHLAAYQGRVDIVEILAHGNETAVFLYTPSEGHVMTPLAMAAIAGHDKTVAKLLEYRNGVCPREKDLIANCAIRSGNISTMKLLIEKDVIWRNTNRNTSPSPIKNGSPYLHPFLMAALHSDLEIVNLLLNHYEQRYSPGVFLAPSDYFGAFAQSFQNSRDDVMELLLQKLLGLLKYGEYTEHTSTLQEGLDNAAQMSKWNCVNLFLGKDSLWKMLKWDDVVTTLAESVNDKADLLEKVGKTVGKDFSQETLAEALMTATLKKKAETARVLLETFKVSPDATGNSWGETALTVAAGDGASDLVTLLLKHGATIDAPFSWPLQAAAAGGYTDIVCQLLKEGADVGRQIDDKRFPWDTALQAAAERGHQGVVSCLLKWRADLNGRRRESSYPIVAAAYLGHTKVVEALSVRFLLDKNVSNIVDTRFGGNPLIGAAGALPTKFVPLFLSSIKAPPSINADAADKHGDTALIRAALAGRADIVKRLLQHRVDVTHVNNRGVNALQSAQEGGNSECLRLLINEVSRVMSSMKKISNPTPVSRVATVADQYSELGDETTDGGGCPTPDFTEQSDETVSIVGSRRSFDIHEGVILGVFV